MVDQFLNNSLYRDLMQPEDYVENSEYKPILSECYLTEKHKSIDSFYPLEAQDSLQEVPFEQFSESEKVLIPGKLPGDAPLLVNAK